MKCPGCGEKYKGKKCPACGRHTDPGVEAKRITRIALLAIVLVAVLVIGYYFIEANNYVNGLQDMVKKILG